MLAVSEGWRNHGIATTLVRKAIDVMVERNADEVVLETEETNVPAMKLYERLGFIRSKKLHRYYLNGNSAYRLVLHLKRMVDMAGDGLVWDIWLKLWGDDKCRKKGIYVAYWVFYHTGKGPPTLRRQNDIQQNGYLESNYSHSIWRQSSESFFCLLKKPSTFACFDGPGFDFRNSSELYNEALMLYSFPDLRPR